MTKKALDDMGQKVKISGVGSTGSGRDLASVMVGADVVKNEITAHAVAALNFIPDVKTILEIGGQDSKIILIRNNVISDFAMNTVCAAGTGSFLDRQAARLGIPIEEFGKKALNSKTKVRIAGRCAVFAESDMIHKQQLGYSQEDIINGLCEALVRNYLNNLAKGKEILSPVVFQGGVAANVGIKKAFENALNCEIYVPEHYNVMGALGAALLAKKEVENTGKTNFLGFEIADSNFKVSGFECDHCPNVCEVVGIYKDDELSARWGDKCGKWKDLNVQYSF
ncbi:CoA-substrate-specific enzyme activase, putative [Alkalithermobacter thermoalcaliphilus JW-YL-7 = DSM 7308]|uniref:CoA-substrate-specific enzyme activase n=1 Tax=Alkalithermobacter thermoalcaliphilus JW-YL-7 = DSM 7308 TaxID=1121328 RepID=A0A150FR32_CLOPD|nr:CoA-substrate-specific enzyme activase [[Clostridium] paradoxum JW-YL-7 = DSM 7308]SHK65080.1 CoA-substrate-specific enzyme activase, putative [[Clostridium] paradoxum JW-YL-7 = DSM 7308]